MTTTDKNTAIDAAILNATRLAGLDMLAKAGVMASKAGDAASAARDKAGSAQDMLVVALATTGVMSEPMTYDILDKTGATVEHVETAVASYALGFKNPDGTDYRYGQSAFRLAMLSGCMGIKGDMQSAGAKKAWTLFCTAFPLAAAVIREGMTARLVAGKLVLEGGTGEAADALRAAKTTTARIKLANDKAGTTGADTGKAPADGEARPASPSEICAEAMKIARKVVAGKEALCPAALSTLRALAALVAANPEAFAD